VTNGLVEHAPSGGGTSSTIAAAAPRGATLGFVLLGWLFGILAFSATLQQLHKEELGKADSENAYGALQDDRTSKQASS
jgi:hypothetical protein